MQIKMKKSTLAVICLIAISVAAFTSCKKKKDPSAQSMITGKWKITSTGTDLNGNGIFDASEVSPTDTFYNNLVITFNSNGTGNSTYYGLTEGLFSWALSNGNAYMDITDTGSYGSTTHLRIDKLSSTSMTLKDTAGGTVNWDVFAKQ